jgi:threonine dehydratase
MDATDVELAADRLQRVSRRTPLESSERLSSELGLSVRLKREDLQIGRSYKVRGAYNLISSLSDAERTRGVICASAGNHAQGVAYACHQLQIEGRIYVPTTTPRQKRERISAIGGRWVELLLVGSTYDESSTAALAESDLSGAIYVHPFDDERTIAAQGSVAIEVFEDRPQVTAIIVPVGGGEHDCRSH